MIKCNSGGGIKSIINWSQSDEIIGKCEWTIIRVYNFVFAIIFFQDSKFLI